MYAWFTDGFDGLAVARAVESDRVWGKVWLIGGGARCQPYFREIAETVLAGIGVGMLPDEAFSTTPFATDWLDTAESRSLLRYQRLDIHDYACRSTPGL